jgi:hypothetical protein
MPRLSQLQHSAQRKLCSAGPSYLLNMLLHDCIDVRDLGTKFHYSWLLMLISLIEWREPQYTYFCEHTSRFRVVWYTSLGATSDPKVKSKNESGVLQQPQGNHFQHLANYSRSDRAIPGHCHLQRDQEHRMDPSTKGSQEGMATIAILYCWK